MRFLYLLAGLSLLAAIKPAPDDGAASIAAGGVVPRRETGVTMAKEVLFISTAKVVVDYDFRNDTAADISTEVAFPVPPYQYSDEHEPSVQSFESFKLIIDGQPKRYQTDVRALAKGHDVTSVLASAHIDIGNFGNANDQGKPQDFDKLTTAGKQTMLSSGAYKKDGDDVEPVYSIHKNYHWTQTFPAHKIVHIRHEYTPVVGGQIFSGGDLGEAPPNGAEGAKLARELVQSACVSPSGIAALRHDTNAGSMEWVDFILTTANSWKRPIEDFTLIVERPRPDEIVSFCWDGPVEQVDANHFRAHTANLIPKKELHIAFYGRPKK